MSIKYKWSDAWILLAIVYASIEKEATLENVIKFADTIEHAILTFEELEGGLARLTMGSFIEEKESYFYPTERVFSILDGVSKIKSNMQDDLRQLEQFLKSSPWKPGYNPKVSSKEKYPNLTKERYLEAVNKYTSKIDENKKKK